MTAADAALSCLKMVSDLDVVGCILRLCDERPGVWEQLVAAQQVRGAVGPGFGQPAYCQPEPLGVQLPGMAPRYNGLLKKFWPEKGFGFIECQELAERFNGQDVFVSEKQVGPFMTGMRVSFMVKENAKGQPQAWELAQEDVSKFEEEIEELRLDTKDGRGYTKEEFVVCYGGEAEWEAARPLPRHVAASAAAAASAQPQYPPGAAAQPRALAVGPADGACALIGGSIGGPISVPAKRVRAVGVALGQPPAGVAPTPIRVSSHMAGVVAPVTSALAGAPVWKPDPATVAASAAAAGPPTHPGDGVQEGRYAGLIKRFNPEKHFGFIECADTHAMYGSDVFLSDKQMPPGCGNLSHVTFSHLLKQGRPQAYDVRESGIATATPVGVGSVAATE